MSKFAPQGSRGCGSPFTHHIFGVTEGEYEAQCNDNLLVIVQIESKSGVENVEQIAAVPGVDVLFVGKKRTAIRCPLQKLTHVECLSRTLRSGKVDGHRVWQRRPRRRDRANLESLQGQWQIRVHLL